MNYYKAREQDTPPYVVFDLVATSEEEFRRLKLEENKLVVTEDRLTNPEHEQYIRYEFGVCHMRVQNQELVSVQQEDIYMAQENLRQAERVAATKNAGDAIEEETFVYDTLKFPMTAGATKLYDAIFATKPESFTLVSTDQGSITLSADAIEGLKSAYYNKVIEVSHKERPPG